MFKNIKSDIKAAMARDPAARNKLEIFLTYDGIKALIRYRLAHKLYLRGWRLIPRLIMSRAKHITGIDIHPGATIGRGVFIDHGDGVVIGETAEIGDDVVIYQGVTLGGTGKDVGKRHPTVKNNVMISAGAKILGPVVIGENSKIGAGSVVLTNVPANCTVVGVPGRIVRMFGQKYDGEGKQKSPDPILDEIKRISKRLNAVEDSVGITGCKYSIAEDSDFTEDPIDSSKL
ncbi:MAG: serine O-acetyltransferase [Christensenellaceae bacterium]|jgi:serine O-acetyltransferase|nr:serine O-acetyltransferase [Christensenellaceae bacterium]